MSGLGVAVRVEWWKLRASPVVATASVLLVALLPGLALAFTVVAARGGGSALALKAGALVTDEGWVGYLLVLDQLVAVAALLGVGVVVAWSFGREHADHTFGALFGLPVPRRVVAAAKFVVLGAWLAGVTAATVLVAVALGLLVDVGPVTLTEVAAELGRLAVVVLLTGLLALCTGLVASIGRGYLPAFGALLLVVLSAQVAVLFGTGAWFPFAAPGLLAVAGAPGAPEVTLVQLALVPTVAGACVLATLRWWGTAEVV